MVNTVILIQIIPRKKSYLSLHTPPQKKKKNCFTHYNLNINSDSFNNKNSN